MTPPQHISLNRGRSDSGVSPNRMLATVTLLLIAYTTNTVSTTTLSSVARDQGQVVFTYPKDVYSERDLSECPVNTACSVVHRRFWQPLLIERHCRCAAPWECPWQWSNDSDNRTVKLDNRAQMKFCKTLKDLPNCSSDQIAITVSSRLLHHTTRRPQSKKAAKLRSGIQTKIPQRPKDLDHRAVTAHCNCEGLSNWSDGSEKGSRDYRCSELKKCDSGQLCGYVRTDLHSTYYLCSCPEGHQCVSRDKQTHNRSLLLYSGSVYNALCTPIN